MQREQRVYHIYYAMRLSHGTPILVELPNLSSIGGGNPEAKLSSLLTTIRAAMLSALKNQPKVFEMH